MKNTTTPWSRSTNIQLYILNNGLSIHAIPPAFLPRVDELSAFCRDTIWQVTTPFCGSHGEWRIERRGEGSSEGYDTAEFEICGPDGPVVEFVMSRAGPDPFLWQYCMLRCQDLDKQGLVQFTGPELPSPVVGPWVAVILYGPFFALDDATHEAVFILLFALTQSFIDEAVQNPQMTKC